MTIQEAIKTKKPFRRKEWDKWYTNIWFLNEKEGMVGHELNIRKITEEDILADDWEVKEELLPCPFCGEKVKLKKIYCPEYENTEDNYMYSIVHNGFDCPINTIKFAGNKETIIELWNRRINNDK